MIAYVLPEGGNLLSTSIGMFIVAVIPVTLFMFGFYLLFKKILGMVREAMLLPFARKTSRKRNV